MVDNMFYNASFNLGSDHGQSKFMWGVKELNLKEPLMEQIVGDSYPHDMVFNFQMNALNKVI